MVPDKVTSPRYKNPVRVLILMCNADRVNVTDITDNIGVHIHVYVFFKGI